MNTPDIQRLIKNAMARLRQPFRGVLHRHDGTQDNPLTQITGLAGETANRVEMMQQFGFTSHPPAGTHCIILPLGGKTAHGIVIATENGQHRARSLAEGETVIYNSHGDNVRLLADGTIEINCQKLVINAAQSVQINSPQVNLSGSLTAAENLTAGGDVADQGGSKTMQGMRDVYNGHQRTPPTSM